VTFEPWETRDDYSGHVPDTRAGFKVAPMAGASYSNKYRCGGRCLLPEECPRCKQYVCSECGKVYPWENGGTDGPECDDCWSAKQPEPEMCIFGEVLVSRPVPGGRLLLYKKYGTRTLKERRFGVARESSDGDVLHVLLVDPDKSKVDTFYQRWTP